MARTSEVLSKYGIKLCATSGTIMGVDAFMLDFGTLWLNKSCGFRGSLLHALIVAFMAKAKGHDCECCSDPCSS